MKRAITRTKRIIMGLLSLLLLVILAGSLYTCSPQFGKLPAGERLTRIQQSPNYKDGQFQNTSATPTYAEGYTFWGEIRKQLFASYPRRTPEGTIPSVKTDLLHLAPDTNVLVWFGHSSYFIQLDGKRFLIDPVFSGNASPIPGSSKAFNGSDLYSVSELPTIDYLLISHDHYDHLDYKTIVALRGKTKKVICGLGVGAHFEHWGYSPDQLIEKDWHEQVMVDTCMVIYTEPARHKSGRSFKQSQSLWVSYLIQTPTLKIYLGGDSGYDTHFDAIGKMYGPIDLAILENGQYDSAWHYVHLLPAETLRAATDLKAKRLLPVHNSKFVIARHPWDEPMRRLAELNKTTNLPLVTPRIGELVYLNDSTQTFTPWWKDIK